MPLKESARYLEGGLGMHTPVSLNDGENDSNGPVVMNDVIQIDSR